jgi:hypothetical protein
MAKHAERVANYQVNKIVKPTVLSKPETLLVLSES